MKDELRKKYLLIRENISNREKKDNYIFNMLINNPQVRKAKQILIYVSFNHEVDTLKLIEYFF